MSKNIVFLFSVLICLTHSHGFVEYVSGVDRTINDQSALSNKKTYPLTLYKDIKFPRQFSRKPQVVLMHEELEWNRNKAVNFFIHASDITVQGFKLNYHIGGPAMITIMRVRYVAVLDYQVEIQYLNFGFNELNRLRQGTGKRVNEFNIPYSKIHYPTPKVIPFLVGLQMDNDDGEAYNLDIKVGQPGTQTFPITFKTREKCKVKSVRVALFICTSNDLIVGQGGAAADKYNKFDDASNKVSRRHEVYEKQVPYKFSMEPHNNILAQGIVSFDVNAKAGNFYIKVGHEYIRNQFYHMSFGTQGNTIVYNMHFAYILRTPALPPRLFLETGENEFQNNNDDHEAQVQF